MEWISDMCMHIAYTLAGIAGVAGVAAAVVANSFEWHYNKLS